MIGREHQHGDLRAPRGARRAPADSRRSNVRDRVQDLHHRGDRGVEVAPPADVVGRLGERLVRGAPQRALRAAERRGIERRGRRRRRRVLVDRVPQAADEARRALHALVRPLERLLGRRGEHREEARGVGAEALDQPLRVDAVAFGLGHLAQALVHRPAACPSGVATS